MKTLSYYFIINPISGCHKRLNDILDGIDRIFPKDSHQQVFTEYAGHATLLAKNAIQKGMDVVVAVGGDGTINEVATGLVGSSAALGLVPRGSGNGFARSMGIPLKPLRALEALRSCEISTVDVGKINEGYFFGVAGVGLDAEIAHAFQNFGKRGPLPYYYVGLRKFKNFGYDTIKIESDEQTFEINPLLITVANTQQYGNGAIIAPQADFADGILDICIVERFPLWATAHNLRQLFRGKITQIPYYRTFKSKSVTIIQQDGNDQFHVDGEPRSGGNVLKISVRPKALRVCIGSNDT